VSHGTGRIEELEANVVIVGPALQEHQHAQAPAGDCGYGGEIEDDGVSLGLRGDRIAQSESRFTSYDSALALNNRQIISILNVDVQHGASLSGVSTGVKARVVPIHYLVLDKNLALVDPEIIGESGKICATEDAVSAPGSSRRSAAHPARWPPGVRLL